ncbi:hypothetical protein GOP47_0014606 [Adiantum capillus-veneris]|uniref:Uncharacterized protein n=1 Tax=Adiantum capillus-veneris TaxID=13818 RepID=A0A9D4UMZ5_ADICA|nr:hypothetical protein GOP47_0014606 [Adiantum capillus-veneris]
MAADEPLLHGSTHHQNVVGECCLGTEESRLEVNEESLLPTPPHLRTFTSLDMATLWWGVVTSVSTFYVAGALVEQGMAWWQGLLTVVLANVFQALFAILIGHAGAKYGIAFPIQCRASLGIRGAHFATCLRGIVACGWFGIDTWIGGQVLFAFIDALCSGQLQDYSSISWLGITLPELGCFFLFWLVQLAFVWHGVHGIRSLEKYASPVLLLLCGGLLLWAYLKAGGFGDMLSASSQFGKDGTKYGQFWTVWVAGLTANVGSYATLSLNISDFTRYARSQTDQILGQVGLPLFVGAFSFVGLAVSSATEKIFGYIISNPTDLIDQIGGAIPTLISLFGVTLALLTTNVANIVAPANALINMSPTIMTFRKGALLTAVVGFVIQPWRLYQSGDAFLNTWLLGAIWLQRSTNDVAALLQALQQLEESSSSVAVWMQW